MGRLYVRKKLIIMKKLGFISLSLILVCLFSVFGFSMWENGDGLYSHTAYMEHIESGRTVIDTNGSERVYPASLTKILTCIAAIESCDNLQEEYEIPSGIFSDIYEEGGAHIFLKAGEKVTVGDLLHATLIRSACDSATALAYYTSGSVEAFADKMNEKAKALGAVNTHFVNAHGLHDDNHYTTAKDLAIITKYALQNEVFYDIISKWSYTIPETNLSDKRYFESTMEIKLPDSKHYYPGVVGVKSGFTDDAGRCLVTTSSRDGESYILVTLGANLDRWYESNMAYEDAKNLHEYCHAAYSQKTLVSMNTPVGKIEVAGGVKDSVDLIALSDISYLCATNEKPVITLDIPDDITAPVSKSESVGTIKVKVGEREFSEPLYPAADIKLSKKTAIISDNPLLTVLNVISVVIFAVAAVILAGFCIIFFKKKPHKTKK